MNSDVTTVTTTKSNGTAHTADATMQSTLAKSLLNPLDTFAERHLGPREAEIAGMLTALGVSSLEELMEQTVPAAIRLDEALNLPPARSESEVLADLQGMAAKNKVFRSYMGLGYSGCITPGVIQRNILENPGWYTQYTPYQAEIAQGRLEALLNFQTMVSDLTGMEIANASMLDEGTAAAEAMTLCKRSQPRKSTANIFFVSELCHPQTIDVVCTRAEPMGYQVIVGDHTSYDFSQPTFGVLIQYPATDGSILDYEAFAATAHEHGALVVVASDLLALTLLRPPGEFGADVVVGNSQRFGVPMGYGGPHAAFMSTSNKYKRLLPGRLIGVSQDATGKPAMRLALQTREQHIRRDKATSNICTAQVLLAVMASMYAVYHGPEGLTRIAQRVKLFTEMLAQSLTAAGYVVNDAPVFDTLKISGEPRTQADIQTAALAKEINLRYFDDGAIGVSLDETVNLPDLRDLLAVFGAADADLDAIATEVSLLFPDAFRRDSNILSHPVFHTYRSETDMLRYMHQLQSRDLSLTHSMIPLGSCTMKLNATTEMIPVTWPAFGALHPFVPLDQTTGYQEMFERLEDWLADITGFAAVSLQPNAGSQGEYTGLLMIRAYHHARGDDHRDICLIPSSAHGTNPASAVMAGMQVVVVACDHDGNIDVDDLRAKADQHADNLAALMVTYPSTHGVFEAAIRESLPNHPRPGRTGVYGWGQHERDGRLIQPGPNWRRRLPPEPAQNIQHSAWRRRSRYGANWCGRASGSVFAGAPGGVRRGRRRGFRRGVGGPVGQFQHSANFVRLHRNDGGRRLNQSQRGFHFECQLHCHSVGATFSGALQRGQ